MIANGHLEILKWIKTSYEKYNPEIGSKIYSIAQSHSHVHIIKWVHEDRKEAIIIDVNIRNNNFKNK